MARPRTYAESDVLDRAAAVFLRLGFHGASIDDLTEATGIGRQSLYDAFGDKAQLYAACLQHDFDNRLARVFEHRTTDDAQGAIARILLAYLTSISHSERPGCLLASSLCQCNSLSSPAAVLATELAQNLAGRLVRLFERAVEAGDLPIHCDVNRAAARCLATMFGAASLAGSAESAPLARLAVQDLLHSLGR